MDTMKNSKFIYSGFAMLILLVGPVILVSPTESSGKACEDSEKKECLRKLETFLKLKSLPFTSDENELNKLCNITVAGYNCSATMSNKPNCFTPREKELFPQYASMAEFTMYMFCTQTSGEVGFLREALLKNSKCILEQREALECCAEYTRLMNMPLLYILDKSKKSVAERQVRTCCPISDYLRCAKPILKENCGEVAANLTEMYVRRSSGEQTEVVCQKVPKYPEPNPEFCEYTSHVCYTGCSTTPIVSQLMALTTLMCLLFISRISFM